MIAPDTGVCHANKNEMQCNVSDLNCRSHHHTHPFVIPRIQALQTCTSRIVLFVQHPLIVEVKILHSIAPHIAHKQNCAALSIFIYVVLHA